MTDDWFRSGAWTPQAQEDFEARLKLARPHNRAQYLRTKGCSLAAAGQLAGARELWQRVLESTTELDADQRPGALEHLADSYVDQSPSTAMAYFERLLDEYPSPSGTSSTQHIKLAELLLDRGAPADLDRAADLLAQWATEEHLPLPDAHFRWQLAAIRLGEAYGDRDTVREAARRALDLVGRGPVFSRHPTTGVVHVDRATLKRLEQLAD